MASKGLIKLYTLAKNTTKMDRTLQVLEDILDLSWTLWKRLCKDDFKLPAAGLAWAPRGE